MTEARFDFWKAIQRMPDGGAGSGAAGGEGSAANTGETGNAPAAGAPEPKRSRRENPLAGVQYGKQAEAPQQDDAAKDTEPTPEEAWKDIRNNKFKTQFDADVQAIVRERLKNSKQAEDKLTKLAPLLKSMSDKYGTPENDIDALVNKFNDDDAQYEDEALRRGMPVAALKQIKQLEREQEEHKRQEEAQANQQFLQQHLQKLAMQGEKLKETFPDFDLRAELNNPEFLRLTSPEVGVDVSTAFWVVHKDQLQPMAMQVGAQETAKRISASIQAGQRRPTENGVRSGAGLDIRDDPRKLSRADREEIRRRVARGERIEF